MAGNDNGDALQIDAISEESAIDDLMSGDVEVQNFLKELGPDLHLNNDKGDGFNLINTHKHLDPKMSLPLMAFNDVRISGAGDKALLTLDRYKSKTGNMAAMAGPQRTNVPKVTKLQDPNKGEEDLRIVNGDS